VAITTLPGASSSDLTTLLGTELADTFALDANDLYVEGLEGSDTVTASDAIDKVTIATGDDNDRVTLSGDFVNGSLLLGTGSDVTSFQNVETSDIKGDRGNDSFDFNRDVETSTIKAGTGNDTLTFDTDLISTAVWGHADDDSVTVTGKTTGSTIYGGKQNDTITITGNASSAVIRADKNNDTLDIDGNLVNSFVNGNAGNDTITVASATITSSTIFGGQGVDVIDAEATSDAVYFDGGKGDDQIELASNKKHTVVGGEGADSIEHDYNTAGGKAVNLSGGVGDDTLKITGANHNAANTLNGGDGEDTIVDTAGDSVLDGGADDDDITTGAGDDVVYGRAGDDTITLDGAGTKLVYGGADDDTFDVTAAFNVNDSIKGDNGSDTIDIQIANATVIDSDFSNVTSVETIASDKTHANGVISFTLGTKAQAAGITTIDISDAVGTSDDVFTVDASGFTSSVNLVIKGSDHAAIVDSLFGGAGADTISTGAEVGAATEEMTGNAGNDLFIIDGDTALVTIKDLRNGDNFEIKPIAEESAHAITVLEDYTAGTATKNNGADQDDAVMTLQSGVDFINMSAAAGTSGFVIATQTAAATTVVGSGNADSIKGSSAADSIVAGAGADTVLAAGGADVITLGDGNDTYSGTEAFAQAVTSIAAGSGTNTFKGTGSASFDLSTDDITGFTTAVFDADGEADTVFVKQGFFQTGATSITLTSATDAHNDIIKLKAGSIAWQGAAETNASDVTEAGEYHLAQDVGDDGVLTYYNQGTSGVTTLTIVGLDLGAVSVATDLLFTA
jgi:hypothetical protein